jgi:GNAT superfamily N-acetyltransferase
MSASQAIDWSDAQWAQTAVAVWVSKAFGLRLWVTTVGMGGCHCDASPKMAHCGMVWGMYVLPAHRKQGIAQCLLQAILDYGRTQQFTMLKLSVTAPQTSALHSDIRAGFVQYAHEPALLVVAGQEIGTILFVLSIRHKGTDMNSSDFPSPSATGAVLVRYVSNCSKTIHGLKSPSSPALIPPIGRPYGETDVGCSMRATRKCHKHDRTTELCRRLYVAIALLQALAH